MMDQVWTNTNDLDNNIYDYGQMVDGTHKCANDQVCKNNETIDDLDKLFNSFNDIRKTRQ